MHRYVYSNDQQIIDHVLHLENIDHEFDALMRRYNLTVSLLHRNKRNATSSLAVHDLSRASIALINAHFAQDFEAFGYEMIEPSLHGPQYLGRRYLVVDVRGGLMNQALEIWTALLMAQRLNRTVVLPQVRARVPKEYIYAHDTNTPLGPFDYLWDETHFVHCARHSIETPNLIDVNQTHHKVQIFSKHIYDMEQHEGIMSLLNGDVSADTQLVSRLRRDNAKYVKVVNPFPLNTLNLQWNHLDRFVPSQRWQEKIAQFRAMMPPVLASWCLQI